MHEFPLIRANHQRISCAEPEWQLQWNPHIRKKIWIKTEANSRKFSNLKWITWSEAGKFEKQTYHLSIGWSGRCHGNGDDEGHERVPIHFKVKVLNDQSTDAEPTDEKWNPQQKGNGKLLRWPTDEDCSWLRRATRAIYREKREGCNRWVGRLMKVSLQKVKKKAPPVVLLLLVCNCDADGRRSSSWELFTASFSDFFFQQNYFSFRFKIHFLHRLWPAVSIVRNNVQFSMIFVEFYVKLLKDSMKMWWNWRENRTMDCSFFSSDLWSFCSWSAAAFE